MSDSASEIARLEGLISDLSRQVNSSISLPSRSAVSDTSGTGSQYWTAEVMDTGGGSSIGAVAGDWNKMFEDRVDSGGSAVTLYRYGWPTARGEAVANVRGLEGEHRFRLCLDCPTPQVVPALFSYSTDSANADIQIIINGAVTRTSFVSPAIYGDPLQIELKQGRNLVTIIANIYVDMFALYWNPLGPFASWKEIS